ncbi:phage tail protein [Brevibacillus sp. SYSU BS000544]|uniref:phage tail protein n=1 Tax=Brevibacillus sp. SYSU BS000544 TaxID=3416443 RepID=UPI003CE4D725
MSEPFIGEIRMFSMKNVPKGWAMCNGQLLPVNGNEVLFFILGTKFGGDGKTTFALPNLQGRVPRLVDSKLIGEANGEEYHTLTVAEMPAHTHLASASASAKKGKVAGNYWGSGSISCYGNDKDVTMSANALSITGSSQPHSNMQPFLALNFCIATTGFYPSKN